MRINFEKSNSVFKGANYNILALSDTHGKIEKADSAFSHIIKNDCFEKEEKGKQNCLIIGGDWFFACGKKGYITDPEKTAMEFQTNILNKFISEIRKRFPKTETILVPGNHEFDGGDCFFWKNAGNIDAEILCTNIDFENSPALSLVDDEEKVIDSKISFVADDKDENKRHAILHLGILPVNFEYYRQLDKTHFIENCNINQKSANPENIEYYEKLDGTRFIENCNINQKSVKPENFKKTKQLVEEKIKAFKKAFPQGAVVLTCHTGVNFADECAKSIPIDLIFDGHEHKDKIRMVGNTPIVSLYKDFNKMTGARLSFGDDGDIKTIKLKDIVPGSMPQEKGEIDKLYTKLLKQDLKKKYYINPANTDLLCLETVGIRSGNNDLANFVTDSILEEIKQIDPEVQIFAINASAIRNGFGLEGNPNVSNINIISCLDGITHNQADILTNKVGGKQLAFLVLDNFLFNSKDSEKNPIIHYSGITIDRTHFMESYNNGATIEELCKFITLEESGEKINPEKSYKIANPEKYFIKSKTPEIIALKDEAHNLGANVKDLFKKHFYRKEVPLRVTKRIF